MIVDVRSLTTVTGLHILDGRRPVVIGDRDVLLGRHSHIVATWANNKGSIDASNDSLVVLSGSNSTLDITSTGIHIGSDVGNRDIDDGFVTLSLGFSLSVGTNLQASGVSSHTGHHSERFHVSGRNLFYLSSNSNNLLFIVVSLNDSIR